MSRTYQIGELSRLAEVPVETVRYYEAQKLLLKPARSHSNYRKYDDVHLERLSFIRHCRSLDMSIDEIRQLLRVKDNPGVGCGEVNAVLDDHIVHVTERLAELKRLRQQLVTLRDRCQAVQVGANCGILAGLSQSSRTTSERSRSIHRDRGVHRK